LVYLLVLWFQIHIKYSFGISIFFHSLYLIALHLHHKSFFFIGLRLHGTQLSVWSAKWRNGMCFYSYRYWEEMNTGAIKLFSIVTNHHRPNLMY
jgi:hypothetical protein